MSDIGLAAVIALGAGLVGVVALRGRRPAAPEYRGGREEQLTRRLARAVGCPPAEALPAVRRELEIAPDQTDDTLVKRAAYHYRREQPDAPCPVYRDRSRG